jgi:regulator of sigma D
MLCRRHSDFCQRKVDYISVTFLEVAMNAISSVSMRAIARTQADVHPLVVHPLMTIALLGGLVWAQLSAWRLSAWI